jgi:hypothetical protein
MQVGLLKREDVSQVLPTKFEEASIRVFCRDPGTLYTSSGICTLVIMHTVRTMYTLQSSVCMHSITGWLLCASVMQHAIRTNGMQ